MGIFDPGSYPTSGGTIITKQDGYQTLQFANGILTISGSNSSVGIPDTNTTNTTFELNGNVVELTDSDGTMLSVDLSSFLDDTNTTNSTLVLNGNTLELTDSSGSMISVDLTSLNDGYLKKTPGTTDQYQFNFDPDAISIYSHDDDDELSFFKVSGNIEDYDLNIKIGDTTGYQTDLGLEIDLLNEKVTLNGHVLFGSNQQTFLGANGNIEKTNSNGIRKSHNPGFGDIIYGFGLQASINVNDLINVVKTDYVIYRTDVFCLESGTIYLAWDKDINSDPEFVHYIHTQQGDVSNFDIGWELIGTAGNEIIRKILTIHELPVGQSNYILKTETVKM